MKYPVFVSKIILSESSICKTCFVLLKPHTTVWKWMLKNRLFGWAMLCMKIHGGDPSWAAGTSRQMHGRQNRVLQESLMNSVTAKATPDSFTTWHRSGKALCTPSLTSQISSTGGRSSALIQHSEFDLSIQEYLNWSWSQLWPGARKLYQETVWKCSLLSN